jgi:hypothetical protein
MSTKRSGHLKSNSERSRIQNLKKYGLTPETFSDLEKSCSSLCMICGEKPISNFGKTVRLHVDHDHETGMVRGLLCGSCNVAIGHFKNSVENLKSAIIYLEKSLQKS